MLAHQLPLPLVFLAPLHCNPAIIHSTCRPAQRLGALIRLASFLKPLLFPTKLQMTGASVQPSLGSSHFRALKETDLNTHQLVGVHLHELKAKGSVCCTVLHSPRPSTSRLKRCVVEVQGQKQVSGEQILYAKLPAIRFSEWPHQTLLIQSNIIRLQRGDGL